MTVAHAGGSYWRVFGGLASVFSCHVPFGRGIRSIIVSGLVATALAASAGSASAQGIFEALFGRPWNPQASAFADPFSQLNPFGSRGPDLPRPDASGGLAYCVRLCDGRFFPLVRHAGASPAQACNSFCPASATKIYNGSSIDNAVGSDDRRYTELATAFVYRDKIVPGCTCNGKDAFGLVTPPIAEDPTLRPGDIVAGNEGLMAYNGTTNDPSFTPVAAYSGLSAELRRQLAETRIAPASDAPAPQLAVPQAEAAQRSSKNKRVQLDR
jgi:hypothetical protein